MPDGNDMTKAITGGQTPTEALRKPKLVCVDDEPLILDILERMVRLRRLDWVVESFTDSVAAWEYLRGGDADVIVTDVSMPHLSGPELVKRLRDNDATRDTPVVVLTGLTEASLKRQVLDFGAHRSLEQADPAGRSIGAAAKRSCVSSNAKTRSSGRTNTWSTW